MSDACCSTSLVAIPLLAPTNLTATPADTSIALSWDAVEGAVSYTVSWNGGGAADSASVTDPSYEITGLTSGVDYIVSVVAVPGTGGNQSPSWPATTTATTTGGTPTPLAAPANIAASALTATSATVSWDAVTDADGYSVTYTPGGTTPQTVTSPTIDLSDLTASTAYEVSVVATDSTGAHTDSEPGTASFTTTA